MSDKIQRLIRKEEKQYKKSYKNLNAFISKYIDEELNNLRSTDFPAYQRHRRLIASIEKIKQNKNVSQAFMDSVDKEYQSSPTSVLVNDRAFSQDQSRTVITNTDQVRKVVSPTSTIQSQRAVIQEANCGIQDHGSIASNRSIIGGKVLFQEDKSVNGIVSETSSKKSNGVYNPEKASASEVFPQSTQQQQSLTHLSPDHNSLSSQPQIKQYNSNETSPINIDMSDSTSYQESISSSENQTINTLTSSINQENYDIIDNQSSQMESDDEDQEFNNDIFCENCLRYQSQHLINITNGLYEIKFVRRSTNQIKKRHHFKNVKACTNPVRDIWLCQQCDNYLNPDIDDTVAKSSLNLWPAFICSTLLDPKVIKVYGNTVWKLIPQLWRYWWVFNIKKSHPVYNDVTLYDPLPAVKDICIEQKEWKSDQQSMFLPRIASSCNKYMMPTVLCPWGCTEFIFSSGHVSLDIMFQRFLQKVNIDLMNDNAVLKFVKYCRDDFIRFDDDYDYLLLNDEDWTVMPSISYVPKKGMQFMVCKNHHGGTTEAYIHPPRQPNHILPCKYSDQICHAVIKPRTVTQMKAQKYSNCFQMHEQRGNFNGIDTCNVTQYRDFKILSTLLEEYESRSIRGRPDINALLDQFVNEEQISSETAECYRNTAKSKTKFLNIDKLCYGSTYVPTKVAVEMQKDKHCIKVVWDSRQDRNEQTLCIKPQFPFYLYPIQKGNSHGATPTLIPLFNDNDKEKNTSMLWVLVGILSQVEEIWSLVANIKLRQSNWHGWILTYIAKTCLTHNNSRACKEDPFKMTFMNKISTLMEKVEYVFSNRSLFDVFLDFSSIYIVNEDYDSDDIDSSVHDCIIFENSCYQNFNEEKFDNEATFNENKYELRLILCINHLSDISYDACSYSRHGGSHSKWWYQEKIKGKGNTVPIQLDCHSPQIIGHGVYYGVYIQCKPSHIGDVGKSLMKYIGGQTHIICATHKLPMVHVPDRKAKCKCGRKEHYRCPELNCLNCICGKCADSLNINIINEIEETNETNDNENDDDDENEDNSHSDDSSLASVLSQIQFPDNEIDNNNNDDDSSSINSDDFCHDKVSDSNLEREEFDNFITHDVPEHDENENGELDDFYIPTTDAGDLAFEIEKNDDLKQTRGVNISGHVILNFVGTLLTRKQHTLKSSSIHKYFLQRLVSTSIGNSVSLLYPEGMLFPSIFWKMEEGALVGAIPATLLKGNTKDLGFATINHHIRSRLTASGYQTSTNEKYICWCYDMATNLATNHHDTRMVVNKGLTASRNKSGELQLRGGSDDSPLLDSVDSKQVIKELMASQKYYPFTHFLTFTCNMKRHFGTKTIKEWIDGEKWKKKYPNYHNLTKKEKHEIKNSLNQAAAPLLLRAWNETCRIFLDYLKKSPHSPFKKVETMFARHEFQASVGNLPHIHLMLRVSWNELSENEQLFVKDLIRASHLDVIRVDEIPRYIEEGLLKHPSDVQVITNLAKSILAHHCTPKCQVRVGENKYVCRKPNFLLMNPKPDNTREVYQDLPNDMSLESLRQLEKAGIIEPLEYDKEMDFMKPFKSRLSYFHPKRHIPPVNWTNDLNISPVEGYTFSYCQSMQNIALIYLSGGCNKYTVKYVGKLDSQNYVIVYTDGHKNGKLITKSTHIHNSKLTASKYNEEKSKNNKREKSHASGAAISLLEMIHHMLEYAEVQSDLRYVDIPTTSLEFRKCNHFNSPKNQNRQDGAHIGNVCDNVRIQKNLAQWRNFTHNQLLILHEYKTSKRSKIDKITEFSIRPPELLLCFDKVGHFNRWFVTGEKAITENDVLGLISLDLSQCAWIDGHCHKITLRRKAINEVMDWLETEIQNDIDYYDDTNGKEEIFNLFTNLHRVILNYDDEENDIDFFEFAESHLLYNDSSEEHLPIPVYSYQRPDMGVQFLLHILLSMGRFSTEIDLMKHSSLRKSFMYAKLIGLNDDEESLEKYADDVFVKFVEEQLIYYPNSRSMIDTWIITSAQLFNETIKYDIIPITDMPPVQQTTLMRMRDEKCEIYLNSIRKEVITSSLTELNESIGRCNIPSMNDLLEATKEQPIQWNAYESLQEKSSVQSEESFEEQKKVVKFCSDIIDKYCDPMQNNMTKSCTIRGFAGCGKSWCMQYAILYCYSKGLIGIPTSIMSRRSVFLGSKHIDILFGLPFDKKGSPYQIANKAIAKLQRYPELLNLLRIIDVLFFDEIGQLPAEMLSVLEIIFRRVRGNNIFMGGVLIISTMDHTQLQPVNGRPFLLSSHVITCFRMIKLECSVRASGDPDFQRMQEIIRMHVSKYNDDPELLDELKNLLRDVPTFVTDWSSSEISSDTYRLYARKTPANEATNSFVNNIRSNIQNENLREKSAIDKERIRLSHNEWANASQDTSKKLDKKVKEPFTLLLFKGGVYEFTHNKEGLYSQGQMALLYDLPEQEVLQRNGKFKVLGAPTGLHDINFDNDKTKEEYIDMGFYEVDVGLAPARTQAISRYKQAQRSQYGLKHRITSTIHASMGDTLSKVAMQITNSKFELWDKAQLIVSVTRTKIGKNLIFVGDKEETVESIIKLVQKRSQWLDYMENILDLITIGEEEQNLTTRVLPHMNQDSFPYRICDMSLPHCKTGFVYFLLSIRTKDYTYIGECNCIVDRLYEHNSGHGSKSTAPAHRRPYAIMGYICGFDGGLGALRKQLEKSWQDRRDYLIGLGNNDVRDLVRAGRHVISELDNDVYQKEIPELRFVELFKG